MEIILIFLACVFGTHLCLGILFLFDNANPIIEISNIYRKVIAGIKEPFELRGYKKEIRELNKELKTFQKIEKMEREKERIKERIDEYKRKYE